MQCQRHCVRRQASGQIAAGLGRAARRVACMLENAGWFALVLKTMAI